MPAARNRRRDFPRDHYDESPLCSIPAWRMSWRNAQRLLAITYRHPMYPLTHQTLLRCRCRSVSTCRGVPVKPCRLNACAHAVMMYWRNICILMSHRGIQPPAWPCRQRRQCLCYRWHLSVRLMPYSAYRQRSAMDVSCFYCTSTLLAILISHAAEATDFIPACARSQLRRR